MAHLTISSMISTIYVVPPMCRALSTQVAYLVFLDFCMSKNPSTIGNLEV